MSASLIKTCHSEPVNDICFKQVEEESMKVRGKEGGQKTWTKQVEEENTKVRG